LRIRIVRSADGDAFDVAIPPVTRIPPAGIDASTVTEFLSFQPAPALDFAI
jgi:hypothetical protein